MRPVLQFSWLAAACVVTAAINVVVLWYARRYRDDPGGRWFLGVIATQGAVALTYGSSLLVVEPLSLRYALGLLWSVVTICNVTVYLGFCLSYTGRGDLLSSPVGRGLVGLAALTAAAVVTDPLHGELVASGQAEFVTELGVPVLDSEPTPLGRAVVLISFLYGVGGAVVLIESFARSWPLFRAQTVALVSTALLTILAGFPPAVALALPSVESLSNLNLAPLTFSVTAVVYTWALYGGDLLDLRPETRRLGRQAALNDLSVPVMTVDVEGRLIAVNAAGQSLLDAEERTVFGDHLGDHVADVPRMDAGTDEVSLVVDGRRRRYRVTADPFTGADGARLGYTLTFQDVTDILQRRRRLTVLNRVLRHNLRNDLTVVRGHAELIAARAEGEIAEFGEVIEETTEGLLTTSERARELDQVIRETEPDQTVRLETVVQDAVADLPQDGGSVSLDVPDNLAVETDPRTLATILENLVENGLEHADGPDPSVTVRARATETVEGTPEAAHADGGLVVTEEMEDFVRIEVADDGPGIARHELEAIRTGTETSLSHGSGLGLWVVQSGVAALGGALAFDAAEGGTTVTLWLPAAGPE